MSGADLETLTLAAVLVIPVLVIALRISKNTARMSELDTDWMRLEVLKRIPPFNRKDDDERE